MSEVTTLEEAFEFVQSVGICSIFSDKIKGVPSLWDAVALPDDQGKTKWGQRVEAIWQWKTELPAVYPDDVFYGKYPGGHAILTSMAYLRDEHYPKHRKPVEQCSELARAVYEIIRLSPNTTAEIRREAMELHGCTKSRFDTALKQLQTTLNVARSNEPDAKKDTWLPFAELYPDFGDE